MKNTKYGFHIFDVNTDMISLTSISNKRLKHIHTKPAVKPTQKYYDYVA